VLQHVTLEVRADEVRACVGFWALLGFEEIPAPPALRDEFTWVQRAATQIHLVVSETPAVAERGHVAVLAPEYDATVRRLADAGFAPKPGLRAWDGDRVFVRDPAGHRIEVMEVAPLPPWPGEGS